MQPYIELNAHHIGNSHVQNGLYCEDFSATYSDDTVSIVVISDGHGDKNCFRSDRGARYACETAVNKCKDFQRITSHIIDIDDCDFDSLVRSLEADIADSWKAKVLSDANVHPFSDQELSVASEQAQEVYRNGQRLEKAYGCTLILSMCTANYWLSVQIGDGKSVAAYRDGVFVEPVPIDENCLGNRSTSLCNSNAKGSFRHYFSKIKPIAAFVSSDGVEESFDQAGLYNFFYSIAYWLKEEGLDIAKSKLDSLLPQISEGGSGDDVSVSIMVSTEDIIAKPRQTLDQIYERVNACENALEQYKNLLADAKERVAEKSKECSDLESDISKLKSELEKKETAHQQALTEQEALQKSADELEIKSQRASEQMEKATKYRASAERYWFTELEKIGLTYQPTPEDNELDDVPDNNENQNIEDQTEEKRDGDIPDLGQPPQTSSSLIYKEEALEATAGQGTGVKPELTEETNHAVAFTNALETSEQEPALVDARGKSSKHFWPFSKQPRQ